MVFTQFIVFAALAAITLPPFTMAAEYRVGDGKGWDVGVDYQAWSSNKEFHVGDILVFDYQSPGSVYSVKEVDFDNCVAAGEAWTSGYDIITLDSPGKRWYISGTGKRCSELGQKMVINVVGSVPSIPPVAPTPGPGTGRKRNRRMLSRKSRNGSHMKVNGRNLKWFTKGARH